MSSSHLFIFSFGLVFSSFVLGTDFNISYLFSIHSQQFIFSEFFCSFSLLFSFFNHSLTLPMRYLYSLTSIISNVCDSMFLLKIVCSSSLVKICSLTRALITIYNFIDHNNIVYYFIFTC